MISKKDLIIAILATFCLTATLFMIMPTRSASSDYNPWADLNGDDKIDILDVVQMTAIYASTGDPTKNVTIAGYATTGGYGTLSIGVSELKDQIIPTRGYRKIAIGIETPTSNINVEVLSTIGYADGIQYSFESFTPTSSETLKVYDISVQSLVVRITNHSAGLITVYIDYHVTA